MRLIFKSAEIKVNVKVKVDVSSGAFAEVVTRPENLRPRDMLGIWLMTQKFLVRPCPPFVTDLDVYRAGAVVQTLFKAFMLGYYPVSDKATWHWSTVDGAWLSLSMKQRREIYRKVGLALDYDF